MKQISDEISLISVTETAAIAASYFTGRGDRDAADQAAVDGMRQAFDKLSLSGTIVIGEGERDEAPMLFIGEQVGLGWQSSARSLGQFDFAVDPLEGTNLCANDLPGSIAVMAMGEKGSLLKAPDTYMNKIVVGPQAKGAIDLTKSPSWNLHAIAQAKGCAVEELIVTILDRPRHQELISQVRQVNAKVRLITDGDVAAALAACLEEGVDVLLGIGGAPEGVIAAAAVRALGGEMQGQLMYRNDRERARAETMGILDHNRIYTTEDLARGEVIFVATGVTSGDLLCGVQRKKDRIETFSLLCRSDQKIARRVHTTLLKETRSL